MSFFLRLSILLPLLFVLIVADDDASPTSLMTEEFCADDDGVWTVWTYVHNSNRTTGDGAAETYKTLTDVANKTCFPPITLQIEQRFQAKSGDSSFEESFFGSLFSYYSSLLKDTDFRFRYCCAINDDYYDDDYPTESMETNTAYPTGSDGWNDYDDEPGVTDETTTIPPALVAPDGATCGKQAIAPSSGLSSRIFGGTDAVPHSWPWVSSLSRHPTPYLSHFR